MGKSTIGWLRNADGVESAEGDDGATWGVIRGCSRVSPGCGGGAPGRAEGKHGGCYAERYGGRFCGTGKSGKLAGRRLPFYGFVDKTEHGARWTGKVELIPEELATPLGWRKPTVIFISMSDIFHEKLYFEEIAAIFAIVAIAERHTFKFLTKRSKRMTSFFLWLAEQADREEEDFEDLTMNDAAEKPCFEGIVLSRCLRDVVAKHGLTGRTIEKACDTSIRAWPLPNLHLGVSVELPDYVERIDDLRAVPAIAKIVSFEPPGGRKILEPELRGRTWTEPTRTHPERIRRHP